MKLIKMEKVRDAKYLKNYELTYENKDKKLKTYEIVSRRDITSIEQIGAKSSGISVIATQGDKLLLLREFRMGINKVIYNLCAGMIEEGETIEECVRRELFEETGLTLSKIYDILPASYAAVAISDVMTNLVYAEVEGEISDVNTSANEQIKAGLYSVDEVKELLKTAEFSSRSQMAAYNFTKQHN